jgi:hypothetical protein
MRGGRVGWGAFLFGYFLLGKQEKVTRRAWMRAGKSHGGRTLAPMINTFWKNRQWHRLTENTPVSIRRVMLR